MIHAGNSQLKGNLDTQSVNPRELGAIGHGLSGQFNRLGDEKPYDIIPENRRQEESGIVLTGSDLSIGHLFALPDAVNNHMKTNQEGALLRKVEAPLITPTDLSPDATKEIAGAMNAILADVFALYLKTKNFHWHISGPHFRDYHLMLDEHAEQLFAMTDDIAERVRKIGRITLRSIGQISKVQRVTDNNAPYVDPLDMIAELREDNKSLAARLREAHEVCEEHRDIATTSLIETWIDQTERRTWFLFETSRVGMPGH